MVSNEYQFIHAEPAGFKQFLLAQHFWRFLETWSVSPWLLQSEGGPSAVGLVEQDQMLEHWRFEKGH
jgi:hypothetical protein